MMQDRPSYAIKPHVSNGMLTCPNCGEGRMPPNRENCFHCGIPFLPSPWICKSCGKEHLFESPQCQNCGATTGFAEIPLNKSPAEPIATNDISPKQNTVPFPTTTPKPHKSVAFEKAPNPKSKPMGFILIILSIMHLTGFHYRILQAFLVDNHFGVLHHVDDLLEIGYGMSRILYADLPIVSVVERGFAIILLISAILMFVSCYKLSNRSYRGVRLDKTARLLLFLSYFAYWILLSTPDFLLSKEPEYGIIVLDIAAIYFKNYRIFPLIMSGVLFIAFYISIFYWSEWGSEHYLPYDRPKNEKH